MNEQTTANARPLNHFLRMAVVAGVKSALQLHITRGDDLNARDANGMTPLMLAAARNNPAICKQLLDAGVHHGLVDPTGKTALEIAIAAGSDAAAAILAATCGQRSIATLEPQSWVRVAPELLTEPVLPSVNTIAVATSNHSEETTSQPTAHESTVAHTSIEAPIPFSAGANTVDTGAFDLSGWEAESEPSRPEINHVVVDAARAIQTAITAHRPIDSSAEWDDIEIDLPEAVPPLVRADNIEGRAKLRLLLLRALREGSVPALNVQSLASNDDHSANPEAEAYVTMVINDLGAEVDERLEYSGSLEVFVNPEETSDEKEILDQALAMIDGATSRRHLPLLIYQREFQQLKLLSAEEEILLAKAMEAALESALDALSTWPDGINRTLAAGADAITGSRPLASISVGGATGPGLTAADNLDTEIPGQMNCEGATDENDERTDEPLIAIGSSAFVDAHRRLTLLMEGSDPAEASTKQIRQALADMRLDRRFLLELGDTANGSGRCPGYEKAMSAFRRARDRMTAANLKLAFFHAKKHLYSGEPLDDLTQEGNIGLLKAVDRYDWRRGFRFSTYATWWIRQQIGRYIADKARTIRVPVHIHEKIQLLARSTQSLEETAGREPTVDELAMRTGMPSETVAKLLRISPEPLPIDEHTIDEMIAIDAREGYTAPDPADLVNAMQREKALASYISSLRTKGQKAEKVLRLRFGIGVHDALTLDEIGKRFDVTRERIRQIEAKAITHLKHPARLEPFARAVLGTAPNASTTARKRDAKVLTNPSKVHEE
ncbi:sigma-70 family RNA polymerase sigma factor [Oryzisolibacter sp. LB2S]|uniref:sigma-70 family RNA polymerase sigma factor n=1 Tax=Alicycliphilus soli TaxID=3228789 RepID=UPI00345927C3